MGQEPARDLDHREFPTLGRQHLRILIYRILVRIPNTNSGIFVPVFHSGDAISSVASANYHKNKDSFGCVVFLRNLATGMHYNEAEASRCKQFWATLGR